MKVHTLGRLAELTRSLLDHVRRKFTFALSRFGERIGRVTVRLSITLGREGATDKRCQVHVKLRPTGDVRVEDTDRDERSVVTHAANRASRAVGRRLELERRVKPPVPSVPVKRATRRVKPPR